MLNHKIISGSQNLEATIAESENTIVLKFTSAFCGPCKQLNKQLEKYDNETNVDLLEISMDDKNNLPAAKKYEVLVVPTLFLIDKQNNILQSHKGAMSINEFYDFIKH
ncbi:Thioredoxin [Spraguea lophii 42_110]|uniref:Thioredoxin n=1 Tax=Spraguea lophii (strain 42_110) TaxID=1358809 RepID=S7WCV1_SPRLO|nr:Thioredoxin [Spraguea lophii 42_110]